ncbi:MAG: SixA phosphatase family protein [Gammaproteobacteria bacterium]
MTDLAKKTLILMRHGKSDWSATERPFQQDIDRPLSARGVRDTKLMAAWLIEQLSAPVNLISSPARRALETAEIVRTGVDVASFEVVDAVYLAEVATLRAVARQSALPNLLIVGHNPGMEDFVEFLCPAIRKTQDSNKLMPTGALYGFEVLGDFSTGSSSRLLFHQRPKWLRS